MKKAMKKVALSKAMKLLGRCADECVCMVSFALASCISSRMQICYYIVRARCCLVPWVVIYKA